MQKIQNETSTLAASGSTAQPATILGYKLCATPCTSAGGFTVDVKPTEPYTHVKLSVKSVKCEGKHSGGTFTSEYKGPKLNEVTSFKVKVGANEHTLERMGEFNNAVLEAVVLKSQCEIPATAQISVEFYGDNCNFSASTEATLNFGSAGAGGCCVIS